MSDEMVAPTVAGSPATGSQPAKPLGEVIHIDQTLVQQHLGEVVRSTVEETLNAMLDADADRLFRAQRYEHSPGRVDTRAGHYERQFHTKAGEVTLRVPKLRSLPFETAITEALWGTRVSPSTVSELNQKIAGQIEAWRNQPIEGEHAYVFLDGLWLKRSWGGEVKNVSVLVAIGVNQDGYREELGVAGGTKEDKASWQAFLRQLKGRGLKGVKLFVGDKCLGLVESLGEFYPEAAYQRCVVHFYRNVWLVPASKVRPVAAMLKAIHASEDRAAAQAKAALVVDKLRELKLPAAAALVEQSIEETFSYYAFPSEHHRSLRTNNPFERIMREIRRRTRMVGAFPDGNSALLLVSARFRHIAGKTWGAKRYLDMSRLRTLETESALSNGQTA